MSKNIVKGESYFVPVPINPFDAYVFWLFKLAKTTNMTEIVYTNVEPGRRSMQPIYVFSLAQHSLEQEHEQLKVYTT